MSKRAPTQAVWRGVADKRRRTPKTAHGVQGAVLPEQGSSRIGCSMQGEGFKKTCYKVQPKCSSVCRRKCTQAWQAAASQQQLQLPSAITFLRHCSRTRFPSVAGRVGTLKLVYFLISLGGTSRRVHMSIHAVYHGAGIVCVCAFLGQKQGSRQLEVEVHIRFQYRLFEKREVNTHKPTYEN